MRVAAFTATVLSLVVVAASCSSKEQYVRAVDDKPFEKTPERVARGSYLVNNLMACGLCHTGRAGEGIQAPEDPNQLLAGFTFEFPGFALIHAPNLTPDNLGTWKDDEIVRAMRDGVNSHGELMFPFMPFSDYRRLSDEDAMSIVAYLRTLPAKKGTPRVASKIYFPMNLMLGMMNFHSTPVKSNPAYDKSTPEKYGETLAHLAHCTACHGGSFPPGLKPGEEGYLTGNPDGEEFPGIGKVFAKNLTPHKEHGLGKYSAEQIENAIRTGHLLNGQPMAPPMSLAVAHYAGMAPEDLKAIIAFIKSIPPVDVKIPERQLTPEGEKLVASWSMPAPAAPPAQPAIEEGESVPPPAEPAPAPAQ